MFPLIGIERPRVKILKSERLRPVAGHVSVALDRLMLVWGGYYMSEHNIETFNTPKDLLVYDTFLDRWFCFKTTGGIPTGEHGKLRRIGRDDVVHIRRIHRNVGRFRSRLRLGFAIVGLASRRTGVEERTNDATQIGRLAL
jgi:hypothetical protein